MGKEQAQESILDHAIPSVVERLGGILSLTLEPSDLMDLYRIQVLLTPHLRHDLLLAELVMGTRLSFTHPSAWRPACSS